MPVPVTVNREVPVPRAVPVPRPYNVVHDRFVDVPRAVNVEVSEIYSFLNYAFHNSRTSCLPAIDSILK